MGEDTGSGTIGKHSPARTAVLIGCGSIALLAILIIASGFPWGHLMPYAVVESCTNEEFVFTHYSKQPKGYVSGVFILDLSEKELTRLGEFRLSIDRSVQPPVVFTGSNRYPAIPLNGNPRTIELDPPNYSRYDAYTRNILSSVYNEWNCALTFTGLDTVISQLDKDKLPVLFVELHWPDGHSLVLHGVVGKSGSE